MIKELKEQRFEIVSVWVDGFNKKGDFSRRSLNFISEPVEIVNGINVQINEAYQACYAFK